MTNWHIGLDDPWPDLYDIIFTDIFTGGIKCVWKCHLSISFEYPARLCESE